MPDPSFLAFARTADAVAATPKRTEKTRRAADYLGALSDDDDLRRAARWLAARAFPLHDQRTVQVGHAGMLNALAGDAEVPHG